MDNYIVAAAINLAPVLILWAETVAERPGFDEDEARTLGRAIIGINACSMVVSVGLFEPTRESVKKMRLEMRET